MTGMIDKFIALAKDAQWGPFKARCIYATSPEYAQLLEEMRSVRQHRNWEPPIPEEYVLVYIDTDVLVRKYPPLPIRMGRYGEWVNELAAHSDSDRQLARDLLRDACEP